MDYISVLLLWIGKNVKILAATLSLHAYIMNKCCKNDGNDFSFTHFNNILYGGDVIKALN